MSPRSFLKLGGGIADAVWMPVSTQPQYMRFGCLFHLSHSTCGRRCLGIRLLGGSAVSCSMASRAARAAARVSGIMVAKDRARDFSAILDIMDTLDPQTNCDEGEIPTSH